MTVTRVTTPSRLHFGLLSFGMKNHPHQFGGTGVMIDQPGLTLEIAPGAKLSTRGTHAERARKFAERVAKAWEIEPCCEIHITSAPRQHMGLGLGTQLGLAIAAGMAHFFEHTLPTNQAEALASAVGRGVRSAIGTHGFLLGGFLLDAGHASEAQLGKLKARREIPEYWRFVLIMPRDQNESQPGLAGKQEVAAFRQTPAVPEAVTERLWTIAQTQLLPAIEQNDFTTFSQALYEYGHLAGECFAAVQHGAYASPAVADLIAQLRSWGYAGCGQSSWGPTVYVVTQTAEEATTLAQRVDSERYEVTISPPNNIGSKIESV